MQIFPGPRFLAEPALRLRAQLPEPRPGAFCPVLVRGEIGKVFTDQSVDGAVSVDRVAANGRQHILVYTESDILHEHSICVTVRAGNKHDRLPAFVTGCPACLSQPVMAARPQVPTGGLPIRRSR
jgi:hypothetical protein